MPSDLHRVGGRHFDAVRVIGANDHDRSDGSHEELAGPHQAPGRSRRRGDEQRLRAPCRKRDVAWSCPCRHRISGCEHRLRFACPERHWTRRAALVAACRGLVVDRITLFARLQMQRRGTLIAEPGTRWIAMVAEGTHPVAKVRGARGDRPVRRTLRAHAGILSRRTAEERARLARGDPRFIPGAENTARLLDVTYRTRRHLRGAERATHPGGCLCLNWSARALRRVLLLNGLTPGALPGKEFGTRVHPRRRGTPSCS